MTIDLLVVPDEIKRALKIKNIFDGIMQLSGKAYRDVPGRKTIQVSLGGNSYFVKQHFGIGWAEIFKSLFSLKKPVLGALTEVKAIKSLDKLGIATTPLAAYGKRGYNPARQQSFIITQDLGDIVSLEDLCGEWVSKHPDPNFKQKVIISMAQLASKLHGAGLCHRDFYLCHFVLKKPIIEHDEVNLILIDLHRMLHSQPSGGIAVMKDIAGLIFSARDVGFTSDDWVLFKKYYLPQTKNFWEKAERRADQLYTKFHSKKFQNRLATEKSKIQ